MTRRMLVIPGGFVPYNDTVTLLAYKRLRKMDYLMDVLAFKGKEDQGILKELMNDEDYHKFARFVVLKTPRNGFFHKYIGTDVEQGAKERFLQDKLPYIDIDNVYNFDNFKSFAKAHEKIVQPSKTLVLTPEHFQGTQR